jgi:hypothetical protein
VPVDKLRPAIAIHSQKPERQSRLNLIQRLLYPKLALAQQPPCLSPTRMNVRPVQGVRELSFRRIPRMRNQVHLGEARCLDLPAVRLPWDGVL